MDRKDFKNEHEPDAKALSTQEYIKKLERENNRLKEELGTDKRLFDHIKEAIDALAPVPKVTYAKPELKHDPLYAVLNVADAHAEELVRAEEMEGLAEYNWNIFLKRLEKTATKTLEMTNIMRQTSTISCLDINSLGDWFVGKILPHEEGYGTTMTMPVAVPKVGRAFGLFLNGLSGHFDKIRVNCICGNHGRDTQKPVYKMTADRNWDMSVYLIAQGYTEQCKNIEWNIPQSISTVTNVMGWKCLLSHSLNVNMTHRTPYYPIETTVDMEHKVRSGTDKDFYYVFLGHWHHQALLDDTIIMCPCMIGANQFSRFKLHRRSIASQLLCFFTEKHGMVNQWPIKLERK